MYIETRRKTQCMQSGVNASKRTWGPGDRSFNLKGRGGGRLWFFVSLRIFFPNNTRVRIFFFVAQKLWIRLFFFFLHQNQNIFFSSIGNQNIFLEKKHNSPFKLNGRSLWNCKTECSNYFTWLSFGTIL